MAIKNNKKTPKKNNTKKVIVSPNKKKVVSSLNKKSNTPIAKKTIVTTSKKKIAKKSSNNTNNKFAKVAVYNPPYHVVNDPKDTVIHAIKSKNAKMKKTRLFLDVDGTLVAMQYNPHYLAKEVQWDSVHRTDFCHWLNSIHAVLDKECEVYVLTNFTYDNEKANKYRWLKDNLKCKYKLILNREGITKSLFVNGKKDILVDDTLRNLDEWYRAGGTISAYQYVTCEKGRRSLLKELIG